MSQAETDAAPSEGRPARRRRPRAHRVGLWSLAATAVGAAALALLVLAMIGQTLRAPDWLRARIEARIEQNLNGMQIAFGDVEFVVNKGWRPRLRLRDVTLSGADGAEIVRLADAEASLAMRPLLQGQVQPKEIALSGASATLRRDASGALSLSLGENAGPIRQAGGLPQLIDSWDQVLAAPQLSALSSVRMEGLSARWEDARQGQAWALDGGRLQLDRTGDALRIAGSFAVLDGSDRASSVEVNYASRIGEAEADFGINIRDIDAHFAAAQSVALAWLDVLDAPISGALRGSVEPDGSLGRLSATLQIGAGVLQPTAQTKPIPFRGARSYFTYAPEERVLIFDELSVDSDWGSGLAEGRAYLDGVETGRLTDLIGQFSLTNISLNPNGLYETPLNLNAAAADFRVEFNPFRVTLGQMHIADPQSQIHLSGAMAAEPEGWTVSVDGRLDRLSPERLIALWPDRAAPKPRKWVSENVLAGNLGNIDMALRIAPGDKPDVYVDFDFTDATIRFLKTMPPITGAAGQVTLLDGRFATTATEGIVTPDEGGPVEIAGTSFIIPDIGIKREAPGVVRVAAEGSVTSVMSLLNRPPLQVLKGTPLPVDLAEGQARATGTLSFPIKQKLQFGEIEFHLDGQIDEVTSTALVPGQTLTAPRLEVRADQTEVVVSGDGAIGPVAAAVSWRQPLGKGVSRASRAEGRVELSQRTIDTFAIGLPPGTVSGSGWGDFTLDLGPGGPPELTVTSDLEGVGLRVPALGWAKPAAGTGLLELTGVLGTPSRLDRLILQAAGLNVTGTVVNRAGGGLERALLSSVRLGNWLDVSAEFVGRGARAPDLRILGGTLDLRRATFGSGGGGGRSETGDLQATLNRLQVTDTLALTGFSGNFTTTGGLTGGFRGAVNGETEVSGTLEPRGDRSAVRIRSQDAGGVFRSAGILQQGRGGAFDLTLQPVGQPGQFDGTLRVTDTRIKDAPAMAALLNAVSVVGLLDELSGQGIQFSEVEARFRLEPSRLILYESSATGPSIGLSMDGTLNVPTGEMDMRGVISPLYMLNSIGSVLTRKGEGMIGFSYRLTGNAKAPSVQVNPLSALAPGMFRDIFRGAPPVPEGPLPELPQRAPPASGGISVGRR